MPASKGRHKPHHTSQQQVQNHNEHKQGSIGKVGRITKITIGFFALFGLVVGYFMAPESTPTLIITPIVGAVIGYFFGHMIEKSLAGK